MLPWEKLGGAPRGIHEALGGVQVTEDEDKGLLGPDSCRAPAPQRGDRNQGRPKAALGEGIPQLRS